MPISAHVRTLARFTASIDLEIIPPFCHLAGQNGAFVGMSSEAKEEGETQEIFYAAWNKDTDVLRRSSSGGIFYPLAFQILSEGGIVYGAAWTPDGVKHIGAETVSELESLMGSKYVRSDLGNVFSEIKDHLHKGRPVMFSGVPCQVSALKKRLGRDDENLICVQVVCHGMPDKNLLALFMQDMEKLQGSKVSHIYFRDKSTGWRNYSMRICFEDGSEIVKKAFDLPFMPGFISDMALESACYRCPFSLGTYAGDITLGDCWGASKKQYPFWNHRWGISVAVTHTPKGKLFFDRSNVVRKEVSREVGIRLNSNLKKHPIPVPVHRKEYCDALKRREVSLAELNKKYLSGSSPKTEVVILSKWRSDECGATFAAYALYQVVRELGFEVKLTDHYAVGSANGKVGEKFLRVQGVRFYLADSFRKRFHLAVEVPILLEGGGRLWVRTDRHSGFFFMDWARASNRKIAYAVSAGGLKEEPCDKFSELTKQYLNRFDAVSLCDADSVLTVKKALGIRADQTCDPVFLLKEQEWAEIAEKAQIELPEGYVLACVSELTEEICAKLRRTAQQRNLSQVLCIKSAVGMVGEDVFPTDDIKIKIIDVSDFFVWLKLFACADYVLTDSWYGCCFSLIFKKQFIALETLQGKEAVNVFPMEQFRVTDRLQTVADAECPQTEMNPEEISARLAEMREVSLCWLKEKLSSQERSPELSLRNKAVAENLGPAHPFFSDVCNKLKREIGRKIKRITKRF